MKITAILLLIGCLQVSAKGFTQGINLSLKNVSLDKVFTELHNQTGYAFFYDLKEIKNAKSVTIDVKNQTLEEVLDQCLKDQPLTYTIVSKTVVIKEKPTPTAAFQPAESLPVVPPPIDITGRVTDADGNPLSGATVKVKGTTKGTTTNNDGVFTLKGVDDNATLEISFVGYEMYTVAVNSRTNIVASLKVNPSPLDEMQVIAYGTRSKRLQTGNVSTVKSGDIEKQPVGNPLLALAGRVPGLFISQSTGYSGSAVTVQVRGKNSISQGTNPLIIVDGVPYSSQLLPNLNTALGSSTGGGTNSPGNYGNPLSFLNSFDIESIEVLKDADATSIYGSRAANGAILITTKKGKAGQTRMDVNFQTGWGEVDHKLNLLNTPQYLQLRREAKINDNTTILATDYDINGVWDTTRYTDWQKVLIGGTSKYLDGQLAFSGGNTSTQFLLGGGFHRETSVFPSDFSDQKGSMHFSVNNTSANKKLSIQVTGSYLFDDNKLPPVDLTGQAVSLPPDAPALFNNDGTLNWALPNPNTLTFGSWTNPMAAMNYKFNSQTKNLISNSSISYKITNDINIKTNLGYTDMQVNEVTMYPSTYFDPYVVSIPGNNPRSANYANNSISSWIMEPQLNYTKRIENGKFDLLLGTTFNKIARDGEVINGSGYTSDLLLNDIKSSSARTITSTENSVYKYEALFGRLNYVLSDKYIVNISGRRDGSSRFGPLNRFHNFWSVAGGWIFSGEKFFSQHLKFLSFGKIRTNYGTTGNDQIGDYQYLDLYSSLSNAVPYLGTNGLVVNSLFNSYLQWEETKKIELGISLGFLKDRIYLDASYYRNRSSNQLLKLALPQITGFPNVPGNLPATVQNSGLEILLNTTNLRFKQLIWTTSINLTVPKNKLVSFDNLSTSPYSQIYLVGHPITEVPLYHAEVDPATGIYKFSDGNGNLVFNPSSVTNPFVRRIDVAPKFYGGLQNSFEFKGFQLDFLFQFVKQTGKDYLYGFLPGNIFSNQPVSLLSGNWQKAGENAMFQKFVSSTSAAVSGNSFLNAYRNSLLSDLIYSDASYIKLRNVSMSWSLPQLWTRKARIQNLKIFVQGQNLFTITSYQGLDPETQSSTSLPVLKVVTVGVHVTL